MPAPSLTFSLFILGALALVVATRTWLMHRQVRYVAGASGRRLGEPRHVVAYTLARSQIAWLSLAVDTTLFLGLTVLGGLAAAAEALRPHLAHWPAGVPLALFGVVAGLAALRTGGLAYLWHFVIEARFGFNRMTPKKFATDALLGAVVVGVLGAGLLAGMLAALAPGGAHAWLAAWGLWASFVVTATVVFPSLIAPLFDRITPLPEGPLRARLTNLLQQCGRPAQALFVMDNSLRSSHGNAYCSGLGRRQRVVLFDTLIARLPEDQIAAVVAHELGHAHHRHLLGRLSLHLMLSLLGFALLGAAAAQPWFYQGLGLTPAPGEPLTAYALLLGLLLWPLAAKLVQGPTRSLARRQEFEADEFAALHTSAATLSNALETLYRDHALPARHDPLYSWIFDSHPPLAARTDRLHAR